MELQEIKSKITLSENPHDYLPLLFEHIEQKFSVINRLTKRVDELEHTMPISRNEDFVLKFDVSDKTYELTKQYFGKSVSKELFGKKKVHFSIAVYLLLKRKFNAVSRSTIRHLDYDDARQFIKIIELKDLPQHYLKMTEKQFETAQKNSDGIPENFRGDHQGQLKLVN